MILSMNLRELNELSIRLGPRERFLRSIQVSAEVFDRLVKAQDPLSKPPSLFPPLHVKLIVSNRLNGEQLILWWSDGTFEGVGMDNHWYYLHTNGALIHKRTDPGADGSDFVRRVWRLDTSNRETAWTLLLEALALGARTNRVAELAEKWGCDSRDLTEFVLRANVTDELRRGCEIYLREVVGIAPDSYWDWLAKTPRGTQPDFSSMPAPTVGSVTNE